MMPGIQVCLLNLLKIDNVKNAMYRYLILEFHYGRILQ